MTVLLQVSDPHFGTERPAVVQALERLAHAQRPDVLLLSGDITQRATAAQFEAARAFVARLQVPRVLAIPGNHDISLFNLAARLFWPYANFQRAFGPALEPEFEDDAVLVLALKTTRRWRHADGELSAAQIERVAQRLAGARPSQWRVVVVHQPIAVTRHEDRHDLLHGREAALKRWAEAGADMIVGGHMHLPFVLPLHERDPTIARPMWVVQAGTAVSDRVRAEAGNSVNIFRIDAGAGNAVSAHAVSAHAVSGDAVSGNAASIVESSCTVERWDHHAAAQRFELAAVYPLARHKAFAP
ncbi:metallophosphoesterase family protein [soil metagenome]